MLSEIVENSLALLFRSKVMGIASRNIDSREQNTHSEVRHRNVKISFPSNTDLPLIIQPVNPNLDFEIDMQDPQLQPYIKENGEINFIVIGGKVSENT